MKKVRRLYPTDEEFTRLLQEGYVLDMSFGPSGAWIEVHEGEELSPTVERLLQLRGVGIEGKDGEGI